MTEVTTIIPCYNEPPERLIKTVESVRVSCGLAQVDYRIIIVDDGSDVSLCADPPIKVVRHSENRGISAALNTGAQRIDEGYVCILAVGDYFRPSKIATQLQHMRDAGSLASYTDWANMRAPSDLSRLPFDSQVCGSTVMVAAEVLRAFPFDESLQYCVDWDWACRIEYAGPGWTHIPEVLTDSFAYEGGHTWRGNQGKRRMQDRARVSKRWRKANKGLWSDPIAR